MRRPGATPFAIRFGLESDPLSPAILVAVFVAAAPKVEVGPPKLGVFIVVDQLGSADLEALQLTDFGGLESRGARFDAWYDNLATETAPGHATLSTGAGVPTHGICANEWMLDAKGKNAIDDPGAQVLGAKEGIGKSARFLEAPTLGDTLKTRFPKSKVISMGGKDRAAILMAGPSADLALWYETATGRYTTSKAYADVLPAWAAAMVDLPARSFATAQWSPIPDGGATRVDDSRPGESRPEGFDVVFPHDLKSLTEAQRPKAYRLTPTSVSDLFKLAIAAIDGEQLGKRGTPDLLWISISATDYAGHNWGPGSAEKVDLLERLSDELRAFNQTLDAKLGKTGWSMVVSSDHGAAPLVEAGAAAKLKTARISTDTLMTAAKNAVGAKLAARVLAIATPHVYLDEKGLNADEKAKLRAAVTFGLSTVPGVRIPGAAEALAVRSNYEDRCGTVLFDLNAYFVFGGGFDAGTDHSSGNAYDRRVPLFVIGPGVKPGRNFTPVEPQDAAPTLAAMMGISPPERSEGRPVQRHLRP